MGTKFIKDGFSKLPTTGEPNNRDEQPLEKLGNLVGIGQAKYVDTKPSC